MKHYLLRIGILIFPMLLGGCVAVWGSAYQVQSQTPESMVVDYDTHFIDDADIEKIASDHCQASGKTALLQSHNVSMMNISTDHFLCKAPVAAPTPNIPIAPKP